MVDSVIGSALDDSIIVSFIKSSVIILVVDALAIVSFIGNLVIDLYVDVDTSFITPVFWISLIYPIVGVSDNISLFKFLIIISVFLSCINFLLLVGDMFFIYSSFIDRKKDS